MRVKAFAEERVGTIAFTVPCSALCEGLFCIEQVKEALTNRLRRSVFEWERRLRSRRGMGRAERYTNNKNYQCGGNNDVCPKTFREP